MSELVHLLKESGYSDKAIRYYLNKVNVGEIKDHDAHFIYTGPCGDTMEFFLKVNSGVITEAKFQAIGCAGSFTAGSALTEMISGKTLEQAQRIDEKDVVDYLEGIPEPKIHCVCLARRTLGLAIEQYQAKLGRR